MGFTLKRVLKNLIGCKDANWERRNCLGIGSVCCRDILN